MGSLVSVNRLLLLTLDPILIHFRHHVHELAHGPLQSAQRWHRRHERRPGHGHRVPLLRRCPRVLHYIHVPPAPCHHSHPQDRSPPFSLRHLLRLGCRHDRLWFCSKLGCPHPPAPAARSL